MFTVAMRARYLTPLEDSARWDDLELRPSDIVVTTPGKCGTTWMQMICALLVFQTTELPVPLHELSPWLDANDQPLDETLRRLDAQQHRRVIKTHTPLDGLPRHDGVTYISVGRDPRDVASSARDHLSNMSWDETDPQARPPTADLSEEQFFWWFIENDIAPTAVPVGFTRLAHHLQDFWDQRDDDRLLLSHYADLTADLDREMRAIAARLEIDVPDDRWPELVNAASFTSMRNHSATTAPGEEHRWKEKQAFFKSARRGSWHHLLPDDAARERYDRRAASLLAPELSAWIHRI